MGASSRIPVVALALAALLAPADAGAVPTSSDPTLEIELYAMGLANPTQLDFVGPDDLLVAEHNAGRIARVLGGVVQAPALVLGGTDRALGVAVSNDAPPFVFVFVEDPLEAPGNRVDRYVWNATTGLLEGGVTILQFPPAVLGTDHDSGALALGPLDDPNSPDDQLLYVTHGDQRQLTGQLQNEPNGTPPDDSSVVLRVRFDGSAAPGNPFTPYCSVTTSSTCSLDTDCPGGEVCRTEVARYWAYGVRNTFGITVDPVTGEVWDTENGDTEWDEVNRLPAGTNSGWVAIQGPADPNAFPPLFDVPGSGSTYRDPDLAWLQPTGPTGIVFPVGSSLGFAYDGTLLFGDFNLPSRIYALPLAPSRLSLDFTAFPALQDGAADSPAELDLLEIATGFDGRVLDLKIGPDGALYVPTYLDGQIYRITGPGRSIPVPLLGPLALVLLAGALAGVALGRAR